MANFTKAVRFVPALFVGVVIAAGCDSNPSEAALQTAAQFQVGDPTNESIAAEKFKICKYGTSGTFEVTSTGSAISGANVDTFTLAAGTCIIASEGIFVSPTGTPTVTVQVLEDLTGLVLDSIRLLTGPTTVTSTLITGTNTVTSDIGGGSSTVGFQGAVAKFYNRVVETGEGCTPGYWKQSQHFGNWVGYTQNQLFSSVFENAFPGMTLLQVLNQGGGGLKALGRHVVAALLNASNPDVDYDLTTAEIIADFNAVFPGGDYGALIGELEALNELGCPLGRAE